MTFPQVWTYLRWPLAIIGLLAVANYAIGNLGEAAGGMVEFDASGSILAPDDGASEDEEALEGLPTAAPAAGLQAPTGAVTDGTATATADLLVSEGTAETTGEDLPIGPGTGDAVVVAFDIPPGDPTCFAELTLGMSALTVDGTVELGVFPAAVEDPAAVLDDEVLGADVRADQTPLATAVITEPGRVTFELAVTYGDYFELDLPSTQPLVLALSPIIPVDEDAGLTFEALEAQADGPPLLRWTGVEGCPGAAAAPTEG